MTTMATMRSMAIRNVPSLGFATRPCVAASRRAFATSVRPSALTCLATAARPRTSPRTWVRRANPCRTYADIGAIPKKSRRSGVLRWIWRLTYLSTIGGIVYLGYSSYQLKHPTEQIEADPDKKTLVILGWSLFVPRCQINSLTLW